MSTATLQFGQIRATVAGLSLLDIQSRTSFLLHLHATGTAATAMQAQTELAGASLCQRISFRSSAVASTPHLMAETVLWDWIHPTFPLLVRSFGTLQPLTFRLSIAARHTYRVRNDLLPCPVLELFDRHGRHLAHLALLCSGSIDPQNRLLTLYSGNGHLILCADDPDASLLRKVYRELYGVSVSRLQGTPLYQEASNAYHALTPQLQQIYPDQPLPQLWLRTLLSKIDASGNVIPDAPHACFDARLQSEVLDTLCRIAPPHTPLAAVCQRLAAAFWNGRQIHRAVRRYRKGALSLPHAAATYPHTVLALLHYEARFEPDAISAHLLEYDRLMAKTLSLLQNGMLPFCEEDGTPQHPSLQATLALRHCLSVLSAYADTYGIILPHLSQEKALASLPLDTEVRFSPKRAVGYCDSCLQRLPTAMLCRLHPTAKGAFLCKSCHVAGRAPLPFTPSNAPFDTYGLAPLPLPHVDTLTFAERLRLCRLNCDRLAQAQLLQQAGTLSPASLSIPMLCDLLLLAKR